MTSHGPRLRTRENLMVMRPPIVKIAVAKPIMVPACGLNLSPKTALPSGIRIVSRMMASQTSGYVAIVPKRPMSLNILKTLPKVPSWARTSETFMTVTMKIIANSNLLFFMQVAP